MASNNAPQIYGGDEVGAIVLDPGSYNTRAGYAGDDSPRYVVPSFYGVNNDSRANAMDVVKDYKTLNYKESYKRREYTYFGEELCHISRNNTDIRGIVNDEVIEDWDGAIEMFDYLFKSLDIEIEDRPVLLTEPVWNTKKNKLKSLEIFLDFFNTPGFYLAKAPACCSFAVGRPNTLVVDIGHNITSVTPVLDGMTLSKNTMKTHYAGKFIDSQLISSFSQRKIGLIPKFEVKSKKILKYSLKEFADHETPVEEYVKKVGLPQHLTKSYVNFELQSLYNEMKETLIVVPETPIADSQKFEYQSRYFELPTGLQVEFEKERYEIGDSLFNPSSYINFWKNHPEYHHETDLEWEEETGEMAALDVNNNYVPLKRGKRKDADEIKDDLEEPEKLAQNGAVDSKISGLSTLINKTISQLDIDIRQQVAHNIVITGSLSLIPGLNDRILKDLNESLPGLKIRLHSSGNIIGRKYQNWIGGSILASLGTFHQLWVSKKEYEEVGGERLITERFR